MNISEIIKDRFSVRDFSNKEIEQEKLDLILKAAQLCPTAVNKQPQKIFVVKNPDVRKKLGEATKFTFNAPIVLVICYDENVAWKNKFIDGYNSGLVDATIACDEMMLQAWDLGIGSCWVGAYDPVKIRDAINLADNYEICALLPIGYPAKDCKPMENMHDKYKNIEDIVEYL